MQPWGRALGNDGRVRQVLCRQVSLKLEDGESASWPFHHCRAGLGWGHPHTPGGLGGAACALQTHSFYLTWR